MYGARGQRADTPDERILGAELDDEKQVGYLAVFTSEGRLGWVALASRHHPP